jgi:hypothetical protein
MKGRKLLHPLSKYFVLIDVVPDEGQETASSLE